MEVTIKNKVLPFPKLMITKYEDKSLVFFVQTKCGFRLDDKQCYSENWRMDVFTDFDGEVTLKNK